MESKENCIGVLLTDDAATIRRAVSRLLEEEPRVKVVGEAVNFSQAVFLAMTLKPDIVLLDLHMPDDHAFVPALDKIAASTLRRTRTGYVAFKRRR